MCHNAGEPTIKPARDVGFRFKFGSRAQTMTTTREDAMDPIRRDILTTGAVAAMAAAAPQVFAQPADPGGPFKFYEKGDVRIRYQDVGSGFPLLCAPGGG